MDTPVVLDFINNRQRNVFLIRLGTRSIIYLYLYIRFIFLCLRKCACLFLEYPTSSLLFLTQGRPTRDHLMDLIHRKLSFNFTRNLYSFNFFYHKVHFLCSVNFSGSNLFTFNIHTLYESSISNQEVRHSSGMYENLSPYSTSNEVPLINVLLMSTPLTILIGLLVFVMTSFYWDSRTWTPQMMCHGFYFYNSVKCTRIIVRSRLIQK